MIKLFSSIDFVFRQSLARHYSNLFRGLCSVDISLYLQHKYPHALLSVRIVKEQFASQVASTYSSRGAHSTAFHFDVNTFFRFAFQRHPQGVTPSHQLGAVCFGVVRILKIYSFVSITDFDYFQKSVTQTLSD